MEQNSHGKTLGRPDVRYCKYGGHDWTEENTYTYRGGKFCRLCRRVSRLKYRRKHPTKNKSVMILDYRFYVSREVVDRVIEECVNHGRSASAVAKEIGISHTTASRIYWAERDRRRLQIVAAR